MPVGRLGIDSFFAKLKTSWRWFVLAVIGRAVWSLGLFELGLGCKQEVGERASDLS